jgi:hypothetical protein
MNFIGKAIHLNDYDLPEVGNTINVGEDEIHAFLDTESAGHGFDHMGRPVMLFEPHVFYRHLEGTFLDRAVRLGLAYPKWGEQPYSHDSYPRLMAAMAIDETAALKSASWGLGQILGVNHAMVGYPTPQAMVQAFCESEKAQLEAIVDFLIANKLDGALRKHDWATLAAGYNGAAYAKNGYDKKLAANFAKWKAIKDTPWPPKAVPVSPQPTPEPKPSVTPQILPPTSLWARFLAFIQTVLAGCRRFLGDLKMLDGQKTNLASIGALGLVGGIAANGGLSAILTYTPLIITILLPILAMTLHDAIKRYGMQSQAVSVEKVLAMAKAAGWGPISQVASVADDIFVKALADDNATTTTTTTTLK